MMNGNTPEYYQRREQQERALAAAAVSPAIASVHADMAERYAQLVSEVSAMTPSAVAHRR